MCERGDGVGRCRGDGVWRVSRRRRLAGASGALAPRPLLHFCVRVHNRCVLHRAQRPSNASHRRRRICGHAAYGQQMDLHPEIFASSVTRRAFQTTPLRMRHRSASMRLSSDAELQRIGIRALASTMCVFCRYRGRLACGAQTYVLHGSRRLQVSSDRIKPNPSTATETHSPRGPESKNDTLILHTRHTSRRRRRTRTPRPPPLPRRVAHAPLVDDERRGADRPH